MYREMNERIQLPKPQSVYVNDISAFCFSQQGESHVKKNVPCQDRSAVRVINQKIVAAAIADGVGSCSMSEYGAETAVNTSLDFLENYFSREMNQPGFIFDNTQKMGQMLREMMQSAYESVERRAQELSQSADLFQSTLTVAVYDGKTLYFGHAGDDGIIALNKQGTYAMVTSRHKGDEASSVYPLQSRNTWQFGKVNDAVAFVMATDGVLDAFVRPSAENNRIYYPFIEPVFFSTVKNEEETKRTCDDWYEFMASEAYRKSVTDDLSYVGVVNQADIAGASKPSFDMKEWQRQTQEYHEKRMAALYPNGRKQSSVSASSGNRAAAGANPSVSANAGKTGIDLKQSAAEMEARQRAEIQKTLEKWQPSQTFFDFANFAAVITECVGKATVYLGESIIEQASNEMKPKTSDNNDNNR